VDQPRNTSNDPLHVPNGPRSKTKALNALVLKVSTKSDLKGYWSIKRSSIQSYLGHEVRRKHSEGNKKILLQL